MKLTFFSYKGAVSSGLNSIQTEKDGGNKNEKNHIFNHDRATGNELNICHS